MERGKGRGYRDAELAFRRYAEYGLDRRRLDMFEIRDAIRGCCSGQSAYDMLAVYDTLRLLEAIGQKECADAVRAVYFAGGGRRPRRNDVTFRVRRHAYERNYDERTIYRQLRRAKEIYRLLRYGSFVFGRS
ncbi:MAG: hypothetical protein GX057_03160 [Clostridiales bacterium]|nr:hypothetical protein [Clostridiales bacterium]